MLKSSRPGQFGLSGWVRLQDMTSKEEMLSSRLSRSCQSLVVSQDTKTEKQRDRTTERQRGRHITTETERLVEHNVPALPSPLGP